MRYIQAERHFQLTQESRRRKQQQLLAVGVKLKELGLELDKYQRGDDRYLVLVTEETKIIKEENKLKLELESSEMEEREKFALLSSAVRESHEKERIRTERTKYWSIIGSVIGAAIGIIGTSVNNYRKMNELRTLVRDSAASGLELRETIAQMAETVQQQQHQLHTVVAGMSSASASVAKPTSKQSSLQTASNDTLLQRTEDILQAIQRLDKQVASELKEVKKVASSASDRRERNADNTFAEYVFVQTDSSVLSNKDVTHALTVTAAVYGISALVIPLAAYLYYGL